MAIASYEVVGSGGVWRVNHDDEPVGSYQTKESAFEAAVAAASLAVQEGIDGLTPNASLPRSTGVSRALQFVGYRHPSGA